MTIKSCGCDHNEICDVCVPPKPTEPVQQAGEPFAWSTFDGEGSYDLRLYEDNENYRKDYIELNGAKYASWVKPLYDHPAPANVLTDELKAELRGIAEQLKKVPFIEVPASADTEINNIVVDLDAAIDKLNALEGK